MGWVLFSFHLQRFYSLVVSDEVGECTWLGSPMCAASGGSSTWGNTWERAYSPVVFDERATLYLVRIFSAARCAGFRQEKSPGRVGRCRIPQRKSLRRCLGLFSLLYRKLQKKSGCDKIGNKIGNET